MDPALTSNVLCRRRQPTTRDLITRSHTTMTPTITALASGAPIHTSQHIHTGVAHASPTTGIVLTGAGTGVAAVVAGRRYRASVSGRSWNSAFPGKPGKDAPAVGGDRSSETILSPEAQQASVASAGSIPLARFSRDPRCNNAQPQWRYRSTDLGPLGISLDFLRAKLAQRNRRKAKRRPQRRAWRRSRLPALK